MTDFKGQGASRNAFPLLRSLSFEVDSQLVLARSHRRCRIHRWNRPIPANTADTAKSAPAGPKVMGVAMTLPRPSSFPSLFLPLSPLSSLLVPFRPFSPPSSSFVSLTPLT